MTKRNRILALSASVACLLAAERATGQSTVLFPAPFRIEHHLRQDDGPGSAYVGAAVRDTYGGSWIVSERPDGSRFVVDFARHEITEVRVADGTYWTSSFEGLAALNVRLRAAQGLGSPAGDRAAQDASAALRKSVTPAPETPLVVTDAVEGPAARLASSASPESQMSASELALISRSSVRHLRVARRGNKAEESVEVWLDSSIMLSSDAVRALAELDGKVASAAAPRGRTFDPASYVSAAREHARGAVVVRTQRPLLDETGAVQGTVEDVATRFERLESFPEKLVQIPEGVRRIAPPLEAVVRYLEEDARRNAAMAGTSTVPPGQR